jgi:hypothetical protein
MELSLNEKIMMLKTKNSQIMGLSVSLKKKQEDYEKYGVGNKVDSKRMK